MTAYDFNREAERSERDTRIYHGMETQLLNRRTKKAEQYKRQTKKNTKENHHAK